MNEEQKYTKLLSLLGCSERIPRETALADCEFLDSFAFYQVFVYLKEQGRVQRIRELEKVRTLEDLLNFM